MTTHPISGCGPGTPRPADTAQEGVRSERHSRETYEVAFDEQMYRLAGMLHAGTSQYEYLAWAIELQKAADLARKVAGWK